MAINVVPVTGGGGGQASPQGRSVQQQSRLNPYVAPKSGLSSFSDAIQPYLMMAMKKQQDLQKRQEIAELMGQTKEGDRSALLRGGNPRPGIYQSMTQTDADNAQKRATMEMTEATRLATIDERKTRAQQHNEVLLAMQTNKHGQEDKTLAGKYAQEKWKTTFLASEKRNNLGTVHDFEKAQLSSKHKAAFRTTEYVRTSKENMQDWNNAFKAGQSSDARQQQKVMADLNAKHKEQAASAQRAGDVDLSKLEQEQKKEINVLQNAFKAGESNKKISSVEMLAKMDDTTTRELSANRLKVKTDINNINNATKKWSTKYTEGAKNWRNKNTQESMTQRQSLGNMHESAMQKSDQTHKILMEDVGNSFEREMVGVKAKIQNDRDYLQRETDAINIELRGAVGERKVKLQSELNSAEARIKHTEDKEMAASNAYLKEEMGLKFRAFDRKTKTDVATIKAKSAEYKTKLGSARLGSTMRKEFNSMTDDFITGLEPVYMNAHEAYRKNTPAGDKAILFAYARYLKPDSTELRKHTVETLQNMSGMPGFVRDLWRKVAGGKEILNPSERKDIKSRLDAFHEKHLESYGQKLKAYKQMAVDSGVDPKLITNLSMSGNLKSYEAGEGTGNTEPGVYMGDTGIPGAGIGEDILNMTGGMHDDNPAGVDRRKKTNRPSYRVID